MGGVFPAIRCGLSEASLKRLDVWTRCPNCHHTGKSASRGRARPFEGRTPPLGMRENCRCSSQGRNVGQCISDLRSGKFVVQCTSVRWQFETSQQFRKASCGGSSHVSHVLLELWELSSCLARSTTLASSMAGPSGTGPRLSLCHHARLAVLQNYSFGSCRKIAGHRLQWSIVSWSTHDRSRMLTTSWHVQGDSGPQGQAVLAALCWS